MSKTIHTCPHCSKEYKSAVWLARHITEGKCQQKTEAEQIIERARAPLRPLHTRENQEPRPREHNSPGLKGAERSVSPFDETPDSDTERSNNMRDLLHNALEPGLEEEEDDSFMTLSDDDYEEAQSVAVEQKKPIVINTSIAMGIFEAMNVAVDAVLTEGQLKPIVEDHIDEYESIIHRIQKKYGISLDGLPEIEFAILYTKDVGTAVHRAGIEEEEEDSDSEPGSAQVKPTPSKKKRRRLMGE